MVEIWKAVPGFEGLYEVSNQGRLRSLPRNTTAGRIMATTTSSGYHRTLLSKEGKFTNVSVHIVVAEVFIGPRPPGLRVLHWDDDKANNRVSNLRYGTDADNGKDKARNGGAKGEKHHKAKLTEEKVRALKVRLLTEKNYDALAAEFEVSKETIQSIKHGRNWGWLKI